MATDLERLVVSLDADIKKFDSSLRRAVATFNGETRKIENQAKTMQKNVQTSFSDLGKGLALGGLTAGLTSGVLAFKDLADAATRTQNALKVAGLSGTELTSVYGRLFQVAQENATPIEDLVKLYSRVAINQKELGVSSDRLVTFSENIAKALRVQGTTAVEAQGALLQLSQALAGGVVRAEEFNSIIEGVPTILQAVAAGMDKTGGSVAKLRQIMLAGQLSSKEFFEAFERGSRILDEKLKGSVLTIDQALVKFRNSLQNAAGQFDKVFGASAKAVEVIGRLATTVEDLGRIFKRFSDSEAGGFIARLAEISGYVDKLIPGIDGLRNLPESIGAIADSLGTDTEQAANKLVGARQDLNDLIKAIQEDDFRKGATGAQDDEFMGLLRSYKLGIITAQDLAKALEELGKVNPDMKPLITQIQELIAKLGEAKAAVAEAVPAMAPTKPFFAGVPDSITQVQQQIQDAQKRDDFLNQRNADAMKNNLERNVETRAKAIIDAAEKLGVALTEAQAKVQARAELQTEAGVKLSDDAISGFVNRVVGAESGGDVNAKNPQSTATGLGQFIESTWLSLFRKYYPEEASNMSRDAILALRTDATKSRALIEAYARENAASLQKAGLSVTEANLQLAHFLGPGGAISVLQAAPGTLAANVLPASAVNANKSILGNGATVDDVIAYAQKRAGMNTTGTQALDNKEDFNQKLAEQQRMLEQLKEETGIRASLNPLVTDYGLKLTTLQKAQELLNLAQQEGTAAGKELTSATQLLNGDLSQLTPEAQKQAEAMRALATQYGQTSAAAEQLKASQEAAVKSSTESLELAKSVTGGILSDIRSALADGKITWKEWGQIAVNALNKVADKLQEMLLNQLFSPTGGLGGLFGGLFGGSSFNLSTATPGLFAKGGYTGPGGKNEPAGIVHKGEYVFDAETVRRIGIANLEAMRGYANGGLVGRVPATIRAGRGGMSDWPEIRVVVDDEGSLRAYVQREGRRTEARVATRTQTTFDNYRSNDLRNDIDSYTSNPRRRGAR